MAAVEKSFAVGSVATDTPHVRPHMDEPSRSELSVDVAGPSSSQAVAESSSTPPPPETPNRCFSCRKRVGLTGFKCRCGNTFCGVHRYAEKHSCTFDFKTTGRETISKANPVIKAAKIDKI